VCFFAGLDEGLGELLALTLPPPFKRPRTLFIFMPGHDVLAPLNSRWPRTSLTDRLNRSIAFLARISNVFSCASVKLPLPTKQILYVRCLCPLTPFVTIFAS